MKLAIVAAIAALMLSAGPAMAWDPDADDLDTGPDDPDPAPFVVPEGIYLVTDVYAGDRVTVDGPTTTYSTATVHETPGSFARVLESVGTGSASSFDGASFNGRASLSDGRAVAGTYYEDFILTSQGFVSVNIVFFQDDSLTRFQTPRPEESPRVPHAAATPPPPARPPIATAGSEPPTGPTPQPRPVIVERERPEPTGGSVTAGVALDRNGPVLASIEVLRGRTLTLWLRGFVDGRPAAVRSWRISGGEPGVTTPGAGSGSEPCTVSWLTLPPAGSSFAVRFDVVVDAAPDRVVRASIGVLVRSPALLQ